MIQHRHWVLLSTCVCQAIVGGVADGIFPMLVSILDTFRTTRTQAGLIFSIMYAFISFIALFSGAIIHNYGARTSCVIGSVLIAVALSACFVATSVLYLVIAIGVFAGSGLGLVFVSCAPTVCQHFLGRSRVMALTIMSASSSCGAMTFSYTLGGLLERFGLRGTCLIMGGISLNAAIMSIVWTTTSSKTQVGQNSTTTISSAKVGSKNIDTTETSTQEIRTLSSSTSRQPLKEALKRVFTNKVFVLFAIGSGVYEAANTSTFIYIVDSMKNDQQHSFFIWLAPVLLNLMMLFGKLFCGLVKQILHCSSLDITIASALLGIFGCLLIAFANYVWVQLVAWCLLGISTGICVTSNSVTTVRLLGKHNLAPGIGLVLTIRGIMISVSGPFNGYIRDVTGSYQLVMVCTSGINTLVGILYIVAKVYRLQEKFAAITAEGTRV